MEQVNQLQQEPILETQIPEVKPNVKPQKSLIIIVGVLVAFLIIGGAIYGGMKLQEKKNSPTPSAKITPTQNVPTAIPTEDLYTEQERSATAGWNIYTNEKYGYFFKYPIKAKLEEGNGYEERLQETIITFFGPKYQGPGEFTDGYGITFAIIKNPESSTPIQLAQKLFTESQKEIIDKILEGDITKCKIEQVSRGGVIGTRFTYCIKAPGNGIENFSEWFEKNGITYQIYAVLQNSSYKGDFDQILSTFKFTQ